MYKKLTTKNRDESIFDLGELIRIGKRLEKKVSTERMEVALWARMLNERHQCQMFAGRTLPGVSRKWGKKARKGQQPPLPRERERIRRKGDGEKISIRMIDRSLYVR